MSTAKPKTKEQPPPEVPEEDDDYGDQDFEAQQEKKEPKSSENDSKSQAPRDPEDLALDALFKKFNDHFRKENRLKLSQECLKEDSQRLDYLSLSAYHRVLSRIGGFKITVAELKKLLIALDCYSGDKDQKVNYSRVMRAFYEREVQAHSGRYERKKNWDPIKSRDGALIRIQKLLKERVAISKKRAKKAAIRKKRMEQFLPNTTIRTDMTTVKQETKGLPLTEEEKAASDVFDAICRKREKLGKKAKPLTPIFQLFDLQKTGKIGFPDFKRALTKAEIKPTLVADTKLKKLFDVLDLEGTGQMHYGLLIEGVEGNRQFKEIRRISAINISTMMEGDRSVTPITQQPLSSTTPVPISSPSVKPLPLSQQRIQSPQSGAPPLDFKQRNLADIQSTLQKLLQQNYPSLKQLKKAFKEDLDQDLVEFDRFHDTLHLNITSQISITELRKIHDELCMKKAATKAQFFQELWGDQKYKYQGSQTLDLDTGAQSLTGGPPTFKPGLSSEERGKFFDGRPELRIDRTLDRYLKELCQILDRECSDYQRELDELIRFHIKQDDKVLQKEKGSKHDGLCFEEFQDLFDIYMPERDKKYARPLFDLLLTPENKPATLQKREEQKEVKKSQKPVITVEEFVTAITKRRPPVNLIIRLQTFLRESKDTAHGRRVRNAFFQQLQKASAEFNGKLIQLGTLQTILNSVGVPTSEADLLYLRTAGLTRNPEDVARPGIGLTLADVNEAPPGHAKRRADYVDLVEFLGRSKPPVTEVDRFDAASRIQSLWRAHFKAKLLKQQELERLKRVSSKRSASKGKTKSSERGSITTTQRSKFSGKQPKTLKDKIKTIVKPPKQAEDPKAKQLLHQFLREKVLYPLLDRVIAHGESLLFGREVQRKYETRPVLRSTFATTTEFKYPVSGVLTRSLKGFDKLGRVLYLDGENKLQQIQVSSGKMLAPVGLGTRPPLKFHPIIDVVCDQQSGRIYTLNRNWILQVWSIEQPESVPITRLTVVNKEIRRDYIKECYSKRYFGAKPLFLALSDQNRQVLVINTTCVDGSFVFIDPISLSVYKRIRLIYSDYEPTKNVRQAAEKLVQYLQEKHGGSLKLFLEREAGIQFTRKGAKSPESSMFFSPKSGLSSPIKQQPSSFGNLAEQTQHSPADGNYSSADIEIESSKLVEILCCTGVRFDLASQLVAHLDMRLSQSVRFQDLETLVRSVVAQFGPGEQPFSASGEQQTQRSRVGFSDTILLSDRGNIGQAEQSLKWPEWIVMEGKVREMKEILFMISETFQANRVDIGKAFGIFDRKGMGFIPEQEFRRTLFKMMPTLQEDQIDLLLRLIDHNQDNYISYREFCKYISPKTVKILRQQTSDQDVREILDQPIEKEATLKYVVRRCHEVGINLKKIFLGKDEAKVNVLPKITFTRILQSLPLGFEDHEINEIMQNEIAFDGQGNVDYTQIMNSEFFTALQRIREQAKMERRQAQMSQRKQQEHRGSMSLAIQQTLSVTSTTNQETTSDARKVVVEDVVYIGDLDIVAYTTLEPKSSAIYISHSQPVNLEGAGLLPSPTAASVGGVSGDQSSSNITMQRYQLLAVLQAHKNYDPPTILYVPESGCIVSGEKSIAPSQIQHGQASELAKQPGTHPTREFKSGGANQGVGAQGYPNYIEKGAGEPFAQIIVWNIQKDMVELFQSRKLPWRVHPAHRFNACHGSIVQLCYLRHSQLLACAATDHTIRFFDPTARPFSLSDPQNIPHIPEKPGVYKPMGHESTQENASFSEVKRIYTGEAICYKLSTLMLEVGPPSAKQGSNSKIGPMRVEWVLSLKLTKAQTVGKLVLNHGDLIGSGIERIWVEVPANRHDDPIPSNLLAQCTEMMQKRRKMAVSRFKSTLHGTLDRMLSEVTVQRAMLEQISKLFKQAALLGRDTGSGGMCEEPVREVYRQLISLPVRSKFSSFLSQLGQAKQLSISEAFFYLTKFCQISPSRTTQLEFDKCVSDFYRRNEQSLINEGSRRWTSKALQKIANFIRSNGLEWEIMPQFAQVPGDHCFSRESFKHFLKDYCGLHHSGGSCHPDYALDDVEIQEISKALDPYMFDKISFKSLEDFFKEELHFHSMASLRKPKKILAEIRNRIIPKRKLQLQQALLQVDKYGDGFIDLTDFLRAFEIAKVGYDKEMLKQLFQAMAENYVAPSLVENDHSKSLREQQHTLSKMGIAPIHEIQKMMNVMFFMQKLFSAQESSDVEDISRTLLHLKSALMYRGIPFDSVFTEPNGNLIMDGEQTQTAKRKSISKQRNMNQKVDLTVQSSKVSQQLSKQQFVERIASLGLPEVAQIEAMKLASFLSINSNNKQVVELSHFLHYLKRVQSASEPSMLSGQRVLPIICSKLLGNKNLFIKVCEEVGDFGLTTRQEEKMLQMADVRSVLMRFNISHAHSDRFLVQICRSSAIHLDDLIAKIQFVVNEAYGPKNRSHTIPDFLTQRMVDLKQTDYFRKLRGAVREAGFDSEQEEERLIELFSQFDRKGTGKIKIYHLINILKYNLSEHDTLTDELLAGLQFELDAISQDGTVDYLEFFEIFLANDGGFGLNRSIATLQSSILAGETEEVIADSFTREDYERDLIRLSEFIGDSGIDIKGAFEVFDSDRDGKISKEEFASALGLMDFMLTEIELNLMWRYLDEDGNDYLSIEELARRVIYAKDIKSEFDAQKWVLSAKHVDQLDTLRKLGLNLGGVEATLKRLLESEAQNPEEVGFISTVVKGRHMSDALRQSGLGFNEKQIEQVVTFAIVGSRRAVAETKEDKGAKSVPPPKIDIQNDLILTENFYKSIDLVISHREHQSQLSQFYDTHGGSKGLSQTAFDSTSGRGAPTVAAASTRAKLTHEEFQLVQKLQTVFVERDMSLYEAFQDVYIQNDQRTQHLSTKDFNTRIKGLSLPLSVREYRRLLRIADAKQTGKINILRLASLFETPRIKQKRYEKLIRKCALLLYLDYGEKNISDMSIAEALGAQFKLFDVDDDGRLTRGEFHSAIRQLGLNLSSMEVDDLMRIGDFNQDGLLSYEEFMHMFVGRVQGVAKEAQTIMEGNLMLRVKSLLLAKDESLFRLLGRYDLQKKGQILLTDLERAFRSLGLRNLSLKQIALLAKLGGASPENTSVKIDKFARKLYENIDRFYTDLSETAVTVLRKIYTVLRSRGLSVFEAFCTFDANLTGKLNRIELFANLHALGLGLREEDLEALWRYTGRSKNKPLLKEAINYQQFLRAFIESGVLKLQQQNQTLDMGDSGAAKKFFLLLKKARYTTDRFWTKADPNNNGAISLFEFSTACKKCGVNLSATQMEMAYSEMVSKQRGGSEEREALTLKALTDSYARTDAQSNLMLEVAKKLEASVTQKAGMSWKKVFEGPDPKSKKHDLNLKELKLRLKGLKSGVSNESIDQLLSYISFGRGGQISATSFQDQLEHFIAMQQDKQDAVINRLKEIARTIKRGIDEESVPFEKIFAECDEEQTGVLNVQQFINFLSAFGVEARKDEVKTIFEAISPGRTHIELEKVKTFISGSIFMKKDAAQEEKKNFQQMREEMDQKNDMYDKIAVALRSKQMHFDVVIKTIGLPQTQYLTRKALGQVMERIGVVLTNKEANVIITDMQETFFRKELSLKDLVEFMLRRKVDSMVGSEGEGGIDPIVLLSMSSIAKSFKKFSIPPERGFQLMKKSRNSSTMNKGEFFLGVEGMQLGLSHEDMVTLFAFIDEKRTGVISENEFMDVFRYVVQGSQALVAGGTQGSERRQITKQQHVMALLRLMGERFEQRGVTFRQMSAFFDINKTGLISRSELASIVQRLKLGIEIEGVRRIIQHFDQSQNGVIHVGELLQAVQEIMNQGSDGLYSLMQSRPILQNVIIHLSGDSGAFLDNLASLERPLAVDGRRGVESALAAKTGVTRRQFFQALEKFGINLSEDEKSLITSAFCYPSRPHMLDIHKLFNVFDSFTEAMTMRQTASSLEWKSSVVRKIASHLKRHNLTIMDCFKELDESRTGLVPAKDMKRALLQLGAGISERDASILVQEIDEAKTGTISLNAFLRNFWSVYSVSIGIEDDETESSVMGRKREQVRFIHAVLKQIKSKKEDLTCERVFAALDRKKLSFLTLSDLQGGLAQVFELVLPLKRAIKLFKFIDVDSNGLIKLNEFRTFWNFNAVEAMRRIESQRRSEQLQYEVFDHLGKTLKNRGITCADVFKQIDIDGNGYIDTHEFASLIQRMGFSISERQLFEMLMEIDDNFDGRISFHQFEKHLKKYGGYGAQNNFEESEGFLWRDKAIEAAIKGLNSVSRSFTGYLAKYDIDGDGILTPNQFRTALKDIKGSGLSDPQIERVLHILSDRRKDVAMRIVISQAVESLQNYDFSELIGRQRGNASQVSEGLFVHVVQRFDGLSALRRNVKEFLAHTDYLTRHYHRIALTRGGPLAAWQKESIYCLNNSALILTNFNDIGAELANTVLTKLREHATSHLLSIQAAAGSDKEVFDDDGDRVQDNQTMESGLTGAQAGALRHHPIPNLENEKIDIDWNSLDYLDSGAKHYEAIMPDRGGERVEVLVYSQDELGYVSVDGKSLEKHLETEMQLHQYLTSEIGDCVFKQYGRFVKKIGLEAQDKEIYCIYEKVDRHRYISLERFMHQNGGLLEMPLLYGTEAAINIARHLSRQLFDIVEKIHEMGATLRHISNSQIYISRDGTHLKLGNCRGAGILSSLGKLFSGPDITLYLQGGLAFKENQKAKSRKGGAARVRDIKSLFSDAFLAPQHLLAKFNEHTVGTDIWSIGVILFALLFGRLPRSFIEVYEEWMLAHSQEQQFEQMNLPLLNPSLNPMFVYNPFNEAVLHLKQVSQNFYWQKKDKTSTRSNLNSCGRILDTLSVVGLLEDQAKAFSGTRENPAASNILPGQERSGLAQRLQQYQEQGVLKGNKFDAPNELGILLDIIAACLDLNPNNRPSITQLKAAPLFIMDSYEEKIASQFAGNAILYRSPLATIYTKLTQPLRGMCAYVMREPSAVLSQDVDILNCISYVQENITHIDTFQLHDMNALLRPGQPRFASPNTPLARQVIDDKVTDMILFLVLRYLKQSEQVQVVETEEAFTYPKPAIAASSNMGDILKKSTRSRPRSKLIRNSSRGSPSRSHATSKRKKKRVQFADDSRGGLARTGRVTSEEMISRFSGMLMEFIREMHSYDTPLSAYPEEVLTFLIKAIIGEEYELASSQLLKTRKSDDLRNYLQQSTFFRNLADLNQNFKPDEADALWTQGKMESHCQGAYLHRQSYWTPLIAETMIPVIQEGICESGLSKQAYKVLLDYIKASDSNFESDAILSADMNDLCNQYIIPSRRTSAYYNEILPLSLNLIALRSNKQLGKAGRRSNLSNIRSLLQTGTSDKIKLCLDMRIPKYIVHFLSDNDADVRSESLQIFYEISRGLEDDDILGGGSIVSGNTTDVMATDFTAQEGLPISRSNPDFSDKKRGVGYSQGQTKKAKEESKGASLFDSHKHYTLSQYLDRATASGNKAHKRETEKFLNFAYDMPNLHFLANKRFLREMATCFQSQLYIVPIVRVLKRPGETVKNKILALRIMENLLCGAPEANTAKIINTLRTPATDTYLSLAKLVVAPRGKDSTRAYNLILPYAMRLLQRIFEMRRPDVLSAMSVYPGIKSLLKEQNLKLPSHVDLVGIMQFVTQMNQAEAKLTAELIQVPQLITLLKELRCWLGANFSYKDAAERQQITERVVRQSVQQCLMLLFRCLTLLWEQFDREVQRKGEFLTFIEAFLSFLDWLCGRDFQHFFVGGNGTPINDFHRQSLAILLERGGYVLSLFRRLPEDRRDLPLTELIDNKAMTDEASKERKYDIFPFSRAGTYIQNIICHLIRKNSSEINGLLNEAVVGEVLGQWLILDLNFMAHCIDHRIEGIVLIDTFVKKNEIRINSFEALLANDQKNLHNQFLNSGFLAKLVGEFLPDQRKFNASYSKITLEMLAFRQCLPLRMEAVSMIRALLAAKEKAHELYSDLVLNMRRHFTFKGETARLKQLQTGQMVQTSLLLFSVLIEADEPHLHFLLKQEGSIEALSELFQERPSLYSRFPVISGVIQQDNSSQMISGKFVN